MSTIQTNREISVACTLGADVLLLRRMRGSEALSAPSEYELELYSERADLKADELLATPIAVTVDLPRGGERHFHGFITRFVVSARRGRYATYRVTVRPWLWFLTLASDCRVFQEQNVVDIVKAVFAKYAIADFDTANLGGGYAPYLYCVQYRESDFDFVSRLLEREGIYYFFRSEAGRHVMVLADSFAAHAAAPGYATLRYVPTEERAIRDSEVVHEWSVGAQVEPGAQALQDFDFEQPAASLLVKSAVARRHGQSRHELFDYPGNYTSRAAGEGYARRRIEARHTGHQRVQGATRARGLYPGALFTLGEHPRADQNARFLLCAAEYVLASDTYEPVRGAEPEPVLECRFEAMPAQQDFRPRPVTPRPVVQGPQTALVVGKAGEETWTDKYGRIKVQFHWDRLGRDDETSSCWVRVAQGWAGKRWGAMFVPRIGQEVVVSFLEGDPDRPLVTGSVYNADNMPPYPLPAQATRSTIRSNASPGGGGHNELRFEDKKGAEQFYLHAERDLEQRVRRDALAWIGGEHHLKVGKDSFEQVAGDRHLKIGGDRREEAGGSVAQEAALDMVVKGGLKSALHAGQTVHVKAGMNVVIEAGANITLKAGAAFLSIGPAVIVGSTMPLPMPSASTAVNAAVLAATVPPGAPPTAPREADDGKN